MHHFKMFNRALLKFEIRLNIKQFNQEDKLLSCQKKIIIWKSSTTKLYLFEHFADQVQITDALL